MALNFFKPALSRLDNWSAFVCILCTQFSPIDPTADAEDSIDNLKMQDNQHILKYNIDFDRLVVQTGWSNNVLWHWHYSGLAEQIKDVMGQQGKPETVPAMKTLAHAINSHWEWFCEKSCSDKPPPKQDNKSQQKSEKKPEISSSNSTKQNPPTSTSSNNNKLAKLSASGNSISNKLGKDDKLSAEEHQRHFNNNLFLYCGDTGHKTADCKKAATSTSKAKAHAAAVKEKQQEEPLKKG